MEPVIVTEHLRKDFTTRLTGLTRKLINDDNYVVDVHTHIFDILCINKSYFIIRFLKDMIGLKSASSTKIKYSISDAYARVNQNSKNWEDKF